eukprot:GGOE01008616.1.p1 GENE.GGOE01008616.1~~GGOE01008616.1.p1  ORF type:complete len:259 (-),score=41.82 GGOE01008616.1:647-1387(-)
MAPSAPFHVRGAPVDPSLSPASDHSDGCSSEGSSAESTGSFLGILQLGRPITNHRRASVASTNAGCRPLCLDFLNGNCGRQRSHCRYYHPTPEEAVGLFTSPLQPVNPLRPICEVWALTGFCKFGARCWKQHPERVAQADAPVAEPVTRKFQEWLLSQSHPTTLPQPLQTTSQFPSAPGPNRALREAVRRLRGATPPAARHAAMVTVGMGPPLGLVDTTDPPLPTPWRRERLIAEQHVLIHNPYSF